MVRGRSWRRKRPKSHICPEHLLGELVGLLEAARRRHDLPIHPGRDGRATSSSATSGSTPTRRDATAPRSFGAGTSRPFPVSTICTATRTLCSATIRAGTRDGTLAVACTTSRTRNEAFGLWRPGRGPPRHTVSTIGTCATRAGSSPRGVQILARLPFRAACAGTVCRRPRHRGVRVRLPGLTAGHSSTPRSPAWRAWPRRRGLQLVHQPGLNDEELAAAAVIVAANSSAGSATGSGTGCWACGTARLPGSTGPAMRCATLRPDRHVTARRRGDAGRRRSIRQVLHRGQFLRRHAGVAAHALPGARQPAGGAEPGAPRNRPVPVLRGRDGAAGRGLGGRRHRCGGPGRRDGWGERNGNAGDRSGPPLPPAGAARPPRTGPALPAPARRQPDAPLHQRHRTGPGGDPPGTGPQLRGAQRAEPAHPHPPARRGWESPPPGTATRR